VRRSADGFPNGVFLPATLRVRMRCSAHPAEIDEYRQGGRYAGLFPERWLPSAVAVLGEPFTEQNRMLNSTLKVVRARVTEAYRGRIDYLYTPEGKAIRNPLNRQVVSAL